MLQSKFECCHFASIFEGVMLLCELRISLWDVELKFCTTLFKCITDQVQMSSLCNRLSLCPFIIFLNFPPICIDNWAEIFKFDFGFFNALFLEKRYIKKSLLKCSWRAYYAPFAVLGYISCKKLWRGTFVFFGPIGKRRWPPWPLIGCDIFYFSSETTVGTSTKPYRKQDPNALYRVCVFHADEYTKNGRPGQSIKKGHIVLRCTICGPLDLLLVHLSQRLKCTIVIMRCPSSVRPSSLTFTFSTSPLKPLNRNVFINSDHKRMQECSISVKGRVICNQRCLESDQPGV